MKIIVSADFFEEIDTEEKAYWLGFIAADGNVNSTHKRFSMSLARKDRAHLERLRIVLNLPYQLMDYTTSNGYEASRIYMTSKKLCSDLNHHGVPPRKSLILSPPIDVSNNLMYHWIRGYFDGDGSVHINKKNYLKSHIAGTEEVCNFIARIIGFGYVRLSSKNLHHVRIYKQSEIKEFYHLLYDDSTIFLERKRDKFIEGFN